MTVTAAKKPTSAASYDNVPYESFTYPQTHPSHVSVIGGLFGFAAPDFKTARILELGCGTGGNLLPLAQVYPKTKCTGVDFSAEQIASANALKDELKLKNVEFSHLDILDFDTKANAEKFDYIICHGVFSWVPEAVREKILDICGKCLQPKGLAVVSYNTLPGWNSVRSLREMMLFHTGRFQKAEEKIVQSRALLDFLADSVPQGNTSWRGLIEDERTLLRGVNDSYLYHDHLENVNAQFYFHEFAAMAGAKGLSYVGDSALSSMFVGNMPQKAMEMLQAVDNILIQEQYMDFINNRRFRTSILCKADQVVNRNLRSDQIMDYHLLANMAPVGDTDPKKDIVFRAPGGGQISTHDVAMGTLFLELVAASPRPVSAAVLVKRVEKKLGNVPEGSIRAMLIECGIPLALRGFLALYPDCPESAAEPGKKPVAFPFARLQARAPGCVMVTNVMGAMIQTDDVANIVMRNLDGTKTDKDIVEILIKAIKDGVLKMNREGKPVEDAEEVRASCAEISADIFKKLARNALLLS